MGGGKAERSMSEPRPVQTGSVNVEPTRPMERTGDPLVRIAQKDGGRRYHIYVQASQVGQFIKARA